MKETEKKLYSVANGGNNVSPLLLASVKAEIAKHPLPTEEIRSAKVKTKLRYSLKAMSSALAVIVLCFFSVMFGFIFMMPAGYAPAPDDGAPDSEYLTSLENLNEIFVAGYSPQAFSKEHSLGLIYPDGDGKLYILEDKAASEIPPVEGSPGIKYVAYKSVYTYSDLTLTIVQTTHPSIRIEEYAKYVSPANRYATYSFMTGNGENVSFAAYETEDGLMALSHLNGNVTYITLNSDKTYDLLGFIYEIVDNIVADIAGANAE